MAPLPANTTARWFFDYVTGNAGVSLEHSVALRFDQVLPGSGDTDPQEKFLQILQAIGVPGFRQGWRVIRVRYQGAGAAFSVPTNMIAGLSAFVGTNTSSGWTAISETAEFTFQGRSFTTGRRVDFSLYGLGIAFSEFFRYTGNAPAYLPTVVAELNDATPLQLLTVDGTPAIWYAYMNVNYNSYWERRQRVG